MTRTTDFSSVQGIARIDWTLKTETPLCIKSGTTSGYVKESNQINFSNKANRPDTEGSVADFYFDARFEDSADAVPRSVFRIPASSIRGALRNYTIKRLVKKDHWRATLFADEKDSETKDADIAQKEKDLESALKDPGWHLIQNLFGLATDNSDKQLQAEGVAGRLQVICDDVIMPVSEVDTQGSPFAVATRSPLDRVTRGTKRSGLHSFMELKHGFKFKVSLRIINPAPEDFGFITFWETSINQGLVRIGGLGGIGKGRLKIEDSRVYLYSRDAGEFSLAEMPPSTLDGREILGDVFPSREFDWSKETTLLFLKKLRTKYNTYAKGDINAQ